MKKYCKKVKDLKSLKDIGLSSGICNLLNEVPIEDIVLAARIGKLDDFLRGKVPADYVMPCYLMVQSALLKAGYLRRDFYEYLESFNWLSFIKAIVDGKYDNGLFDGASNIQRILSGMTNDQYESFDGLSALQIRALNTILKSCFLYDRSYYLVLIRFGLNGKESRPREDIADVIGEDVSYIRDLEEEAIEKFGTAATPIINKILS